MRASLVSLWPYFYISVFLNVQASPAPPVVYEYGTDHEQAVLREHVKHVEEQWPLGYQDPRLGGGSMLDLTGHDLGEPMNVIISAKSDPRVLTDWGFRHYANSLGFHAECLNQHRGGPQQADLGDGLGYRDQQILYRQNYFPVLGTCWESLAGGNHFRAWRQNGTHANTGAWFLATSIEKYLGEGHMIISDGYDKGRDWLVERAIENTRWRGMWWRADVEWVEGLLHPGWKGINHNITIDGLVAVLTVHRI